MAREPGGIHRPWGHEMVEQASIPTISAETHTAKPRGGYLSEAWREAFKAGYSVTVQDAVAELGISERSIRRRMDADQLRHIKVGTRILLLTDDVHALRQTIYLEALAKQAKEKAAAKKASQ